MGKYTKHKQKINGIEKELTDLFNHRGKDEGLIELKWEVGG